MHDLQGLLMRRVRFSQSHIKCILKQLVQAALDHLEGSSTARSSSSILSLISPSMVTLSSEGVVRLSTISQEAQRDCGYLSPASLANPGMCPSESSAIFSIGLIALELFSGESLFGRVGSHSRQVESLLGLLGYSQLSKYEASLRSQGLWPSPALTSRCSKLSLAATLYRKLPKLPKPCQHFIIDLLTKEDLLLSELPNHEYFQSAPQPCEPSELPRIEIPCRFSSYM